VSNCAPPRNLGASWDVASQKKKVDTFLCMFIRACVCRIVCAYKITYAYMFVHIYICVCVCVCVCLIWNVQLAISSHHIHF